MSFIIIQSTPYGEHQHEVQYLQLIEAKAFAEVFMVQEDDCLTDPNRNWQISENGPYKGCHIMDVHNDYSIIIKEI